MPPVNLSTFKTSRAQIPAVARKVSNYKGKTVLNVGCGRFPHLFSDFVLQQGAKRVINYDPNLDSDYLTTLPNIPNAFNFNHYNAITATRPDIIIVANVLNVLNTPLLVRDVLQKVAQIARGHSDIYFSIYEGSKTGIRAVTRDGYQLNRRTADYVPTISKGIPSHAFEIKGQLIVGRPKNAALSNRRGLISNV